MLVRGVVAAVSVATVVARMCVEVARVFVAVVVIDVGGVGVGVVVGVILFLLMWWVL